MVLYALCGYLERAYVKIPVDWDPKEQKGDPKNLIQESDAEETALEILKFSAFSCNSEWELLVKNSIFFNINFRNYE